MSQSNLPQQRWVFYPRDNRYASELAHSNNLSPILSQLLINRGVASQTKLISYLDPEQVKLPSPLTEFPDLKTAIAILKTAISKSHKISICGDYDADGMTSTALLIRSLKYYGAIVDYAIPSRMKDGYGINTRIVDEFHSEGVKVIITVDNGISALEAISHARSLGIDVIVTDHHDLPPQLPPANAILNPKLIPPTSPYSGLAGVGVAYVLAMCLGQELGSVKELVPDMMSLFALGTIADLAPLTGVNRRWVKRGLHYLPKSELPGIKSLIKSAAVVKGKAIRQDDIGFRLAPRINAIGRIGNPQTVITLLTTDDEAIAQQCADECEETNALRQSMCTEIEEQAIAYIQHNLVKTIDRDRILLVVQHGWHHGVVGIVASRIVEKYGVPAFIGTYEENGQVRGSIRSIPEFNVFDALQYSGDLLLKYGGHKAAGGFSLLSENLDALRSRLSEFAHTCLQPHHLKPIVRIDSEIDFSQISWYVVRELNTLEPCGMQNPEPVFCSRNVEVTSTKTVGKGHVRLELTQTVNDCEYKFNAIAWRWEQYSLPKTIDIAYKVKENTFAGKTTIQLEILGIRPSAPALTLTP